METLALEPKWVDKAVEVAGAVDALVVVSGQGKKPKSNKKGQQGNKTTSNLEKKFAHQQLNKPVATFTDVKDHILEKIQREYRYGHDVVKSLREGQRINLDAEMPQYTASTKVDSNGDLLQPVK